MKKIHVRFLLIFLTVNTVVVLCWGFANESISYLNQSAELSFKHVTTHVSHHSWGHYIGNMLAMIILLHVFPSQPKVLAWAFLVCIFATGMYVIVASVPSYIGASALLYCVPGCWYVKVSKTNLKIANLVLVIILLYLFFMSPLKNLSLNPQWQPLTGAHLIGFLAGAVVQFIFNFIQTGKHIEK